MPSQLLHVLFGEDVIAEIYRRLAPGFGLVAEKAMKRIQDTHKKVFALGCQGPDIFYHSQGSRPVGLEYGTLLHRRGAGVFTARLLQMGLPDPPPDEEDIRMGRREKGISALGVYALGYMTHAILDRLAHPYIVYKSDRPPPARLDRSHAFFERIIDVLMLEKLRGTPISSWDQEALLAQTCEDPPLGLKELLARALVLVYPERAEKDEKLSLRIENTFKDSAFFYRVTAPANTMISNPVLQPFPMKKGYIAYLFPEDLPPNIDFLNLENRPWYYPAGKAKKDLRSFPQLYSEAVLTAADTLTPIFKSYLEAGLFPIKEAARAIGNGGLSIVDKTGKPCPPTRSAPLPLQEVLTNQAQKRNTQ